MTVRLEVRLRAVTVLTFSKRTGMAARWERQSAQSPVCDGWPQAPAASLLDPLFDQFSADSDGARTFSCSDFLHRLKHKFTEHNASSSCDRRVRLDVRRCSADMAKSWKGFQQRRHPVVSHGSLNPIPVRCVRVDLGSGPRTTVRFTTGVRCMRRWQVSSCRLFCLASPRRTVQITICSRAALRG